MSFLSWLWQMVTGDFEEPSAPPVEPPDSHALGAAEEVADRPVDSSGGLLSFVAGVDTGAATLREGRKFLKPGTGGTVLIEVEVKKPHFELTWYEGKAGPAGLEDLFEQEEELSWSEGQDFLSGWGGVTGQLPIVELTEAELTIQKERFTKADISGPAIGGGGFLSDLGKDAPIPMGYHKQIPITVVKGRPYEGGLIIDEGHGHDCEFTTEATGIEARVKVARGDKRTTTVTFPKGGWYWTKKGPDLKYGGNMGKIIDKGKWTGEGTKVTVDVQPKSTYSKAFVLKQGTIRVEVSQRWDIFVQKKKYKKWKFGGPVLKYILKVYSYFSQKGEKAGIFGKGWKKWKDYLYSK